MSAPRLVYRNRARVWSKAELAALTAERVAAWRASREQDEPTDPAALEMQRRDSDDAAYTYVAIAWSVVLGLAIAAWIAGCLRLGGAL